MVLIIQLNIYIQSLDYIVINIILFVLKTRVESLFFVISCFSYLQLQQNQKYQILMRQQSESNPQSQSGFTIDSNQARKQRINKKRAIRKNKINNSPQQIIQNNLPEKLTTKQQKMLIQKAKNRQAAQRSRDQHKIYVQSLEQQIKQLKQLLEQPQLCSKCLGVIKNRPLQQLQQNNLDYENENEFEALLGNQNNQELEQFQSPFIRMHQYEQSSSLKMYFFIAMIILGVLMMSGSMDGKQQNNMILNRDLMEVESRKQNNGLNENVAINSVQKINLDKHIKQINHEDQMKNIKKFDLMNSIQNSFNMNIQSSNDNLMTEIVPLTYQLSPLSQQNCIKSIIDRNYTRHNFNYQINSLKHKSSSLQNYEMQVFTRSNQQNTDNILFCSLPKIYKKSSQVGSGLLSKFVDIIISGSEVMQILGQSPNLWMSKLINLNGLYKINAQIKNIVRIEDTNCIL